MARDEAASEVAAQPARRVRFRAFVSYSHADAAVAKRLQRRLETYRVPRRLAERVDPIGGASGRIGPVFRDREDLPASADLSEAVKEALAGSRALIVLCSPDAARSRWVAREIELFRALHPDRPVLAALTRGTPEEAIPVELRKDGAEPLAADFRRSGDGRKLAFLKVVAGILGIPLDELIQREGQRRQRRVMAVTAAAIAAMLVLATMTILAMQARKEAERQRAEAERQRAKAEGLVEYMLTDLRQRLKEVGRVDVMNNVNQHAMAYYEDQGPVENLPDASLERRARVIGVMGEDDELSGNLNRARARYEVLYEATRALLAKQPDDPARILAHARSENRLALLANTQHRLPEALRRFERTRRLLGSIVWWGRTRGEWLRLSAFANGNICATMLKSGRGAAALDHCRRAVAYNEQLVALRPEDDTAKYDLVFHRLWLAQAQSAAGQGDAARRSQALYLDLMARLIEGQRGNMLLLEQQMQLYSSHSELLAAQGEPRAAWNFLERARRISGQLVARDPKNAVWAAYRKQLSNPPAWSRQNGLQ